MRTFPYDCQILTRTGGTIEDDYGNVQSVQGTIDTTCDLQQVRTTEPEQAGETSVSTWDLLLPHGTSLDTSDAVVVNGKTYELVGSPWFADTGSTRVNHVEATVVRAGE